MSAQVQIQRNVLSRSTSQARPVPTSNLSAEIQELKRECETVEARLYHHIQIKRQRKVFHIEDPESTTSLNCLFERYEDLISLLLNQQSPLTNVDQLKKEVSDVISGISEKSWKLVYTRIEELRKIEEMNREKDEMIRKSAVEELKRHLSCSESFYQNLILGLMLRFDLHQFNMPNYDWRDTCAYSFVCDCYIHLGDIARYQAAIENNLASKLWIRAQDLHLRSIRMKPDDGLPYAKIGVVATNMNDDFNTLYWLCLSFGNNVPTVIAKDNLKVMYNRRAKKNVPSSPPSNATLSEKIFFCAHLFLEFQKNVLFCDQTTPPANMLTQYGVIVDYINGMIDFAKSNKTSNSWELEFQKLAYFLKKIIVILIISFNDLNVKFKESGSPGVRQQIRHVQVIILAMFFDILCKLLDTLHNEITSFKRSHQTIVHSPNGSTSVDISPAELEDFGGSVDLYSTFFSENGVNPLMYIFQTIGIGCIWLSSNLENITQYKTYIKTVSQGDREKYLVRRLFRFAHSLANIINTLFLIADMDESSEFLCEDEELLGTAVLREYYREKMDIESIKRVCGQQFSRFLFAGEVEEVNESIGGLETLEARVSRIALLARKMAEDGRCDFFSFETEESKFAVTDEQTKREKLRIIGQMMGRERLKEEVNILEKQVKEMAVPTVVLDPECFVSNLRQVKKWVMTSDCIIVVARDVLNYLDRMKKGTETINANARQASRFLDSRLKYSTKFIRLQEQGEVIVLWDREGVISSERKITSTKSAMSTFMGDSSFPLTITTDSGFSESSNSEPEIRHLPDPEPHPIPKLYRPLLACCLHFQKQANAPGIDKANIPFALVTNSETLTQVALNIGVPTATMNEWNMILSIRCGNGKRRGRR